MWILIVSNWYYTIIVDQIAKLALRLSAIISMHGICQEGHFIYHEEIDNWYPIIISNQVFWKITNN